MAPLELDFISGGAAVVWDKHFWVIIEGVALGMCAHCSCEVCWVKQSRCLAVFVGPQFFVLGYHRKERVSTGQMIVINRISPSSSFYRPLLPNMSILLWEDKYILFLWVGHSLCREVGKMVIHQLEFWFEGEPPEFWWRSKILLGWSNNLVIDKPVLGMIRLIHIQKTINYLKTRWKTPFSMRNFCHTQLDINI